MARNSPIFPQHEDAGAVFAPYGPENDGIPVVQVCSGIDREYAAIRKSAAIMDMPHRAVLTITGSDRLSFLNRMLTQELKGLLGDNRPPFELRNSFWLNRKGRIDADLAVIAQADSILLEVDAHAAPRTIEGLSSFIIADDVQVTDLSAQTHRIDLHGPDAAALLSRTALPAAGSPSIAELPPRRAAFFQIGRETACIWRHDLTGEPGYSLSVRTDSASDVYSLLAEPLDAIDHDRHRPDRGFELKRRAASGDGRAVRTGWHAFNIARIETGVPLYNLDFGPSSLPHETGDETLNDRVSFKKGCYLGQEVVARMNSLGHPKQRLVALDLPSSLSASPQPVTGSLVFATESAAEAPIGAVTSSAISPMLGSRPICFAMVKYANSSPETTVFLQTVPDAAPTPARVRKSLRFWSGQAAAQAAV